MHNDKIIDVRLQSETSVIKFVGFQFRPQSFSIVFIHRIFLNSKKDTKDLRFLYSSKWRYEMQE